MKAQNQRFWLSNLFVRLPTFRSRFTWCLLDITLFGRKPLTLVLSAVRLRQTMPPIYRGKLRLMPSRPNSTAPSRAVNHSAFKETFRVASISGVKLGLSFEEKVVKMKAQTNGSDYQTYLYVSPTFRSSLHFDARFDITLFGRKTFTLVLSLRSVTETRPCPYIWGKLRLMPSRPNSTAPSRAVNHSRLSGNVPRREHISCAKLGLSFEWKSGENESSKQTVLTIKLICTSPPPSDLASLRCPLRHHIIREKTSHTRTFSRSVWDRPCPYI